MKFRKKPIVIEAFQMTKAARLSNENWPQWLHEAWNSTVYPSKFPDSDGTDELCINTLEGTHLVSFDDWIIRGVKGELYPCKPDIFAATYEPVEGDGAGVGQGGGELPSQTRPRNEVGIIRHGFT